MIAAPSVETHFPPRICEAVRKSFIISFFTTTWTEFFLTQGNLPLSAALGLCEATLWATAALIDAAIQPYFAKFFTHLGWKSWQHLWLRTFLVLSLTVATGALLLPVPPLHLFTTLAVNGLWRLLFPSYQPFSPERAAIWPPGAASMWEGFFFGSEGQ